MPACRQGSRAARPPRVSCCSRIAPRPGPTDYPADLAPADRATATRNSLLKVSVLILTYNHEPYIAGAIDSALMQQTDFDFEVVISEDCSTDRTRAIVTDYETRHPDRIRVRYSPQNLGDVRSFVLTYQQCHGDYVAVLEGDDYWTSPHKLQKQADFLDRHPECSLCGHGMLEIREGTEGPPVAWMLPWQKEISTIEDLILHNFVHTGSAMLRTEVFNDYPQWVYDAPFSDYPLWIQAAQQGDVGYIKEFLGVYRIHGGGVWSRRSRLDQVNDMISFYERLKEELAPGHEEVFERVLARSYGQLACERAGVPWEADILVATGGDRELLKVRPRARHFAQASDGGTGFAPMGARRLFESLESARAEGAQFLLIPRTAMPWLENGNATGRRLAWRFRGGLRRELEKRYTRIWDGPDELLYELRDHAVAASRASA